MDTENTKKNNEKKKPVPKRSLPQGRCEECEFYDYDELTDTYSCQVALDEDELAEFVSGQTGRCPYFRFYDEYKMVRKQN